MKAIAIEHYGDVSQLKERELPTPEPGEGEVLIRIKAIGVNPVDFKIRQGHLDGFIPSRFPLIPGWDMSGVIESRGYGARRFEIGESVYGYCRRPTIQFGTYAEFIVVPESFLAAKPSTIDYPEAAGVPLAGLTAYQSLFTYGKLVSGQTALIVGASGGVGSFAVQLAKLRGSIVTAVAGSKNAEYVTKLGAHHFVDHANLEFLQSLKQMNPTGFDLIFDCYGHQTTDLLYPLVKPGGALVSILNQKNDELANQFKVNFHYVFVEPNSKQLEEIAKLFESGKMVAPETKHFPLSDAAKAHTALESGHTRGKLVLIP